MVRLPHLSFDTCIIIHFILSQGLKSFDLEVMMRPITVTGRLTRFLFIAAFQTMATLEQLSFKDIGFEDRSCATEWRQMGRKITLHYHLHQEEIRRFFDELRAVNARLRL